MTPKTITENQNNYDKYFYNEKKKKEDEKKNKEFVESLPAFGSAVDVGELFTE